MKVKAYGKVNIGLRVGDRRPDGYHDIDTYMGRIALADSLDILIRPADAFSCRISGNEGYLNEGEEDLMEKAAKVFSSSASLSFGIDIAIEKHIPVQGGLGGGSSDAAAVLTALDSYFGTGLDLVALGAEVSSDVPFFASGYRFAHVTGRGEQVEESPGPERMPVILAVPEHKVPTGYAFSVLDAIKRDRTPLPPLTRDIPDKKDFPNDFELIGENACPFIKADGFASLSGSGAVWYLIPELFQDEWLEIRGYCVKYKTEFI